MIAKPFRIAIAMLACAAPFSAAQADEFTIFIYETPQEIALRADKTAAGAAYWAAFSDYSTTLGKAGIIRGGAPLVPEIDAKSPMVLSGYFQIEAPTLADAQSYAALAPSNTRGGKAVAVAHMPSPAMAAN